MKGGKNEMFTIFKKALSIDAKKKGNLAIAFDLTIICGISEPFGPLFPTSR